MVAQFLLDPLIEHFGVF